MTGPFLVGDWKVDPSAHTLGGASGEIRLEPKVMQVLVLLAKDAGRVVSKERLLQTVWADTFVGDEVLSRAISELRRAFDDDSKAPRVIQTIPKGGYRLMAPVRMPSTAGDQREVVQTAFSGGSTERWTRRLIWASLAIAAIAALWFIRSKDRTPENRPAATAGRTVLFTSFPGREDAPSFSPDGSRLAFQWNPKGGNAFRIFVRLIGDDPPQQLTDGPGSDVFPAWSPDGRTITFTRIEIARAGIFLVPALGGPARKVIDLDWHPFCVPAPQWSPDGRQLVFEVKNGLTCRVEVLSLETFTRRGLTSPTPPSSDHSPTFSPDGRTIAFVRNRAMSSGRDIQVMSAEGGPARRVTDDNSGIWGALAWTPDGHYLIFASDRGGSLALWRVAVAGGAPERLQAGGNLVASPALDRAGRRLAYVQTHGDVQIYDVDPSRPQDPPREVAPSSKRDSSPRFSADGRRLAFESSRAGAGTFFDIWLADADGSNPVRLTFFDRGSAGSPRWSPDGQSIAFDSGAYGGQDIFVVRATGGTPRRLTTDPAEDAIPSWSRDGRWIYFESARTGLAQIWKVPSGGGQAIQVTSAGGFAAEESSDGRYLYYSKSDEDGRIWRMPLNGGSEELVRSEPLPFLYARCWALVEDGLYYLDAANVDRPSVAFFSFATRRATRVTTLPRRVESLNSSLTISPDRRHLLVALTQQAESDIMLTDDLR